MYRSYTFFTNSVLSCDSLHNLENHTNISILSCARTVFGIMMVYVIIKPSIVRGRTPWESRGQADWQPGADVYHSSSLYGSPQSAVMHYSASAWSRPRGSAERSAFYGPPAASVFVALLSWSAVFTALRHCLPSLQYGTCFINCNATEEEIAITNRFLYDLKKRRIRRLREIYITRDCGNYSLLKMKGKKGMKYSIYK